ncbi:MAG: M48 family metallopeptidase [Minisyncoccota bacterium]
MFKQECERNGIKYILRKDRRARKLRLTLSQDGQCRVTLPFFVSYAQGHLFVMQQSEWIAQKKVLLSTRKKSLIGVGGIREYHALRQRAQALIEHRLRHFQPLYKVRWGEVRIRNQKTRWGSCTKQGNLSFNYRLLLLPEHLRDYVIVHELCHLIEHNHSARFWNLVAETLPNFQSLRQELAIL